jgi:predicted RNA-binding Zn-ribbon protein involved in translation (DUF1610 family)
MTHAHTRGQQESGGLVGQRKSVLICPRCSHESTVRGDWIHIVREDSVDVHCPDCWTQLTTRPR